MPITPSNSSPRLGHFCVDTHVADMSPTLTGHWPPLGPRSSSIIDIIVTTATTCQTECCLSRRLKKIKRKGKPEIRTLHRGFLLSTIILLEVSIFFRCHLGLHGATSNSSTSIFASGSLVSSVWCFFGPFEIFFICGGFSFLSSPHIMGIGEFY